MVVTVDAESCRRAHARLHVAMPYNTVAAGTLMYAVYDSIHQRTSCYCVAAMSSAIRDSTRHSSYSQLHAATDVDACTASTSVAALLYVMYLAAMLLDTSVQLRRR